MHTYRQTDIHTLINYIQKLHTLISCINYVHACIHTYITYNTRQYNTNTNANANTNANTIQYNTNTIQYNTIIHTYIDT